MEDWIKTQLVQMTDELKREIRNRYTENWIRTELREMADELREEIKSGIAELRGEIRSVNMELRKITTEVKNDDKDQKNDQRENERADTISDKDDERQNDSDKTDEDEDDNDNETDDDEMEELERLRLTQLKNMADELRGGIQSDKMHLRREKMHLRMITDAKEETDITDDDDGNEDDEELTELGLTPSVISQLYQDTSDWSPVSPPQRHSPMLLLHVKDTHTKLLPQTSISSPNPDTVEGATPSPPVTPKD